MIDVEMAKNGRFAGVIRVPRVYENSLHKNEEIVLHAGAVGGSVAYCFCNEMYYAAPRPANVKEVRRQLLWLAGLGRGSLDRLRFYMALRTAVAHHGIRPSLSGAKNLMRLITIQDKMQGGQGK